MSSTVQYDAKVHPVQAEMLTQRGATDREIAEFFGISPGVFYSWRTKHPEFCNALKDGKEIADDRVERSLYNRAVGYDYDAVKIITVAQGQNMGSEVVKVPYVEHVPPDVKAAIRWLEARRPKVWRRTVGLTGGDGGPIQFGDGEDELAGLTDDERAQLRGLLSKAAAGSDSGRGEG